MNASFTLVAMLALGQSPEAAKTPESPAPAAVTASATKPAADPASATPAPAASESDLKGWELKASDDGIDVYSRERPGNPVKEMKAIGEIDAAPKVVLAVLQDLERYTEIMPYTDEAKVISRDGEKATHFYTVINAPLVSRRDYCIRLEDQSDWKEGAGFLKTAWNLCKADMPGFPPERKGMIRVQVNEGYWRLEPREGGKKTLAIYYVFTDPGGSVAKWIVNRANGTAVPNVFKGIRKAAKDPRYAQK